MIEANTVNFKEVIDTRAERRSSLSELMHRLDSKNVNCRLCTGVCCTSVANSMQIDNIQTIDLYVYLKKNDLFDPIELRECIEEYRLTPTNTGSKGQYLRKRYTCPFFKREKLGCMISPDYKPYGCLGFNAQAENVKNGEACGVYQEELENRESNRVDEVALNKKLSSELNLINDKQPIPIKLLELDLALKKLKIKLKN